MSGDSTFAWNTQGMAANSCGISTARNDGQGEWDVARNPCLFAGTENLSVPGSRIPGSFQTDLKQLGNHSQFTGCSESGCTVSTLLEGVWQSPRPWFGPWLCHRECRVRPASRPEGGSSRSVPAVPAPVGCGPTTPSSAGVGISTAKHRHQAEGSLPSYQSMMVMPLQLRRAGPPGPSGSSPSRTAAPAPDPPDRRSGSVPGPPAWPAGSDPPGP